MLNGLDRRLILALQEDGRITNVELAKRMNLHISTIKKKMDQLEQKGLVTVRALPNPFKLGYVAHGVIALKADSLHIGSICCALNELFNVNLIITTFGYYDILAITYHRTWEDLLSMVSTVIPKLNGIRVVDTFMVKEVKKRHYSFSDRNETPVKVDEIDQKLIERLTEDGRLTYRRLAEEFGLSPATCLRRVSRLLEEKVIEIKGVPYMSKIESVSNAFMLLHADPDKLDDICETLKQHEEVYLMMTLINGYSFIIGFNTSNPEELFHFKNNILSLPGITGGVITVRAEIKKRYYGGYLK